MIIGGLIIIYRYYTIHIYILHYIYNGVYNSVYNSVYNGVFFDFILSSFSLTFIFVSYL